jgi:hypothetical protein
MTKLDTPDDAAKRGVPWLCAEGQAVMATMLILMREHRVPSFSMYDGIIVPRSKADIATVTLKQVFKKVVGRPNNFDPVHLQDLRNQ